jgi:hypothetical protein
VRVADQIIGETLESDKAAKLRVFGLVDDAHSAAAELFDDAVMRNDLESLLKNRSWPGMLGCAQEQVNVGDEPINSRIIERQRTARKVESDGVVTISSFVFHDQGRKIDDYRKVWGHRLPQGWPVPLTPHDLRRSAARNLVRAGVPEDIAMQVGGWRSRSIFTRYNITSEADVVAAVKKVNLYNAAESKKVVAMGASR